MKRKPRIVCLGGGNAMPKAVLTGLKKQPVELSVICAMLDSGGSSGRLRKDYQINAPGDLRRALISLANTSPVMENLFNFRFEAGDLAGHSFANLLIMALELSTNDYGQTLSFLRKTLKIKHQVLPVTLDKSEVCALLENGRMVRGEARIDRPKHGSRIKKVYLEPPVQAYQPAVAAIKKADLIVIGPGDLYSTLAQILLIQGITDSISKSKAKILYLCNLMTKKGETDDFSVLDFSSQIEKWLAGPLDFVLYNNFFPETKRIKQYQKIHPELLEMVAIPAGPKDSKFLARNLLYNQGSIEHDPAKVCTAILAFLN